jgi:hypothetical protein
MSESEKSPETPDFDIVKSKVTKKLEEMRACKEEIEKLVASVGWYSLNGYLKVESESIIKLIDQLKSTFTSINHIKSTQQLPANLTKSIPAIPVNQPYSMHERKVRAPSSNQPIADWQKQ